MKISGVQQDRRRRLEQIASAQAGHFTARQAASVGYSSRLQHHHADVGNWQRIERGIYRLPSWPGSRHDGFLLASLWSQGKGVTSYDSALAFHEMSDLMPAEIHLTVPRGFRKRRPGVILHHDDLLEKDIQAGPGFRVTTPLRTLADAARSTLSPEHLEAAVRDGLRQGLLRRPQLLDLALELPHAAAVRLRKAVGGAVA